MTWNRLLQENGSFLLQEDGTKILLDPMATDTVEPEMKLSVTKTTSQESIFTA